jgi:hypothetical protein
MAALCLLSNQEYVPYHRGRQIHAHIPPSRSVRILACVYLAQNGVRYGLALAREHWVNLTRVDK